jgi:hypothetical protein
MLNKERKNMTNPITDVEVDAVTPNNNIILNELIITIEGTDTRIPLQSLGLTMQSTEQEILDAVRPLILEQFNIDISDGSDHSFTTRKAMNSNTIYAYPKPVAGFAG